MKKTYINPETIVVELMHAGRIMMYVSEGMGDDGEGQFAKELYDTDSSDNTGRKNIWDEEW